MSLVRGDVVDVIADVRLTGPGRTDPFGAELVDVHVAREIIVDIAPAGALPRRGAVLEGSGGWLLPGLWDHHVHTVQWALAARRVVLEGAASAAEAAALMGATPAGDDGRRVGSGFRDALWVDRPDLPLLDAATGDVPTYLINSDVHSVWLNSAALRREGMWAADGVLREEPAFEISRRLNALDVDLADAAVMEAARAASARGVVGIVDLDMAWNAGAWDRRVSRGFDAVRVSFGVYASSLERAIEAGLQTGDAIDAGRLVRMGPFKVITDGSLGTRTAACSHHYPGRTGDFGVMTVPPEELTALMHRATGAGISCAVHAIGDVANSHALDAFAATGATGTIEHAQLVAHADIPRFARLGVAASIQPAHAVDDRDMADEFWAGQTAIAYPLRELADAGANLLFGSDAPVAPLDPWATMAAAVFRTGDGRGPWRPHQRLDAATALAASTAHGSHAGTALAPGAPSDLIVVDRDPLAATADGLRATVVAATLLGGRLTHVA
ncbi:amidohydrolase [Microbacterium oleivorans]|uniref:Amidohydrolase family protein n=1 Tax=Microbacterium oleivorans TaxID=273677 RepID=A0A7D5IXF6_9MICO|nr:amidohydrolase family protein [Microbacterium oleivorans]QLD10415.1 amidohydrolase family protein [Microbacterium oleivorans]